MSEPTLTSYAESDWTNSSTASEVTASLSWNAGDLVLVVGGTADLSDTLATPTATGLTFSLIDSTSAASACRTYLWTASAGSSGSGAITSTTDGATAARGLSAWALGNQTGIGTPVKLSASASKTVNLTRTSDNSWVLGVFCDWNGGADVTVTTDPSGGTQREASQATGGAMKSFVFEWGDQGATGTTAYGVANDADTTSISAIVVEVKGTASGITPRMSLLGVG